MNTVFKVADIGRLSGPLLVFGGVYSNLQALEALRQVADEAGIATGNILCTGDVVGYCAQPEACVQMLRDWGIHVIAGNVEIQLRNGETDCGCNFGDGSRCDLFSRQWYPFAQSRLSTESIEWMRGLPDHLTFEYADKRVYMVHGSFFNTSEFVFRSTDWSIKQSNFDACGADIILAGHCGLPFEEMQNNRYWLNAGVIGMPANDGTPRVWYMILEDILGALHYRHCPLQYDHETAAELMEIHQLPREYSKTLVTGLWDNCEILPPTETAAMGIAL